MQMACVFTRSETAVAKILFNGIMRDNPHPARAIKDLCPLEGVLVPPKRAVDLGRFFLCRSEAAGRERGRVSCFCADHLAYNKISSAM